MNARVRGARAPARGATDRTMTVVGVALVAFGAALGAPTRWWVDVYMQRRWLPVFPWGTFTVNAAGSLLLGLLVGRWGTDGTAVILVGIGFCGALTTFSSFAWESHRLAEDGARQLALINVVTTSVVCLGAATTGWWLGS
jgi:fluoride exporter